jgi:PAS domain S-box-containing protein
MGAGRDAAADGFETLADSVSDAIVLAGADSRIRTWSRGAEAMFGWSADEAVGQSLTMLMPERYHDAHLAGMARLSGGGEPRLVGRGPVALEALARGGREFPIELTIGRWATAGGDRYVGIIRDLTARHEAERHRAAQTAVAGALAEAGSALEASAGVLRALGEALDWPLGALWVVDADDDVLRLAALWERAPVPEFARQTRELQFAREVGLPGRTWAARRPQWIEDVTGDANFPRVHAAVAEGLRAGVGLPLLVDGEVTGVMEFYCREIRRPTAELIDLMAAMSEQVAQVLERKRAEETLAEVSWRERQAAAINSDVIDHLVQASGALDRGDVRAAQREIRATLAHASRIITELGVPRP